MKYYKQVYKNKFSDLDEVGKYLKRSELPKLTQEK